MSADRVAGEWTSRQQVGWVRRFKSDPTAIGWLHSERDHQNDECGTGDWCEPVYSTPFVPPVTQSTEAE